MTESVIKQIKDPNRFSIADQHIARIVGEQRVQKPTYYRHKETGAEFCYLAGGIAWPRDPKEKPGFAVIVAVEKSTDDKPSMYVLEEAESPTIDGLLKECVRLQKKYGAVECSDLFRVWYGDAERADTSVTLFNHETTKDPDKIFVVQPYDFEKPNAFERHVNQLFDSLIRDPATGKKRLYLSNCTRLQNYIRNASVDAAVKGDSKDYPALSALGGLIHTLMMLMPWSEFVKPERTFPTVYDPLTELEDDYERALWENDDQEEVDDGALVETI